MNFKIGAMVGGLAAMWLAGCADTTVSSVPAGTFVGRHTLAVFVPRFVANPRWASEFTSLFIADLSAQSKAVVVRGDNVARVGEDAESESTSPTSDAGILAARQLGAGLMVLGDVSTRSADGGFVAVATMQVVRLSDSSTVARLRRETTNADEHQAALAAVKQTASAMAAGY